MTPRHTRTRSVPRRRQLTALIAGAVVPLVLLTGMLLPTSLQQTEAGWTESTELEVEASAKTIPAATLTRQCEYRPGLVGIASRVRIHWKPAENYELEDVVLLRESGGVGSVLEPLLGFSLLSSTSDNNDGTFTTTIPTGLLGGLVDVGSTLRFGIATEEDGWRSEPVVIEARTGLLGSGTCEHLTG